MEEMIMGISIVVTVIVFAVYSIMIIKKENEEMKKKTDNDK